MNIYHRLDMGSPAGLLLYFTVPIVIIALIIMTAGIISAVRFALKAGKKDRQEKDPGGTEDGDSSDEH